MNLLAWIVIGGIAGWLADLVVPRVRFGLLGDIFIGIVGAFVGGLVLSLLLPGQFSFTGFNFESLFVAFVGALLLLLIISLFRGKRATQRD